VRTVLRGVGKTCIAAGVLILLFVAYQLWGTGIAEARSQRALKRQFAAATSTTVAPTTTRPPTTSSSTVAPATTTTLPPLPAPPTGSAIAILKIPRIGVNVAIVQGVGVDDLKRGPGHYPRTPLPGQAGNAAIAGHRTTYGAPFYSLNDLKPGDDIFVSTRDGTWDYQVMFSHDVSPSDVAVLNPTTDNRLTLTTCTPRFTALKRLVVVSRLIGAVDSRPVAPPSSEAPATTIPGDTTVTTPPVALGGADVGSLSGQGASTAPAIVWAIVCAAIWLAAWFAARRWRPWIAYSIGTPIFLVTLYFFFENFARFVPANL
jgi:sortase A